MRRKKRRGAKGWGEARSHVSTSNYISDKVPVPTPKPLKLTHGWFDVQSRGSNWIANGNEIRSKRCARNPSPILRTATGLLRKRVRCRQLVQQ